MDMDMKRKIMDEDIIKLARLHGKGSSRAGIVTTVGAATTNSGGEHGESLDCPVRVRVAGRKLNDFRIAGKKGRRPLQGRR